MNRMILIPVAVAVTLSLAGCFQPVSSGPEASGSHTTPTDEVSYIERSSNGVFNYETVLDTDVRVVVRGESDDGTAFPPLDGAIVRFESESGSAVFQGRTGENGAVSGTASLPAAPQDVTLRVSADGYAPREVTIPDMVEYAEVSRVMYFEQGSFSTQIAGDVDSDKDGVPDVYDAFPNKKAAAFATDYPADGTYTVAFEDLYGRERAGDADYNDFVAQYSITEETNDAGQITKIRGDATAIAKIAGYTHRFGLFFRFDGDARLKILYNQTAADAAMDQIQGRLVTDEADVVLFHSTNAAVGRTSVFELDFEVTENPQDPANINRAPYDPYLYVKDTQHDVHLIGEEPLPDSNNPDDDDFRDADGYPWALLVPADWKHPDEGQRIDEAYPAFTYWRESEGTYYPDWYHYYGVDPGPPSVGLAVTYDGNGQMTGAAPSDETDYVEGEDVTVLGNTGNLRRPGYGFVGWNTESDGTGETREVGSTFAMPAEDVTLYAQWKDDYAIGEEGPAGGWIFYDHGTLHPDGWRYLEAAPEDVSDAGTETFAWSNVTNASVGVTSTGIGTGEGNTALIVAQTGHDSSAAQRTIDYTTEQLGGSFGDWFLPSSDELNEMYRGLHSVSTGGFVNDDYWSSSEQQAQFAEYRSFDTGASFGRFKGSALRVRPVRAF